MKQNAQIELIRGSAGMGTIAQRLLHANMNVNALRTNDVLRKEEWKQYDESIVKAAQLRLVGVADLIRRGLVYRVGSGLGKMILEYEDQSDIGDAQMSMDGLTRGRNDRPEFSLKGLPLPIIHKDYQISSRTLAASRQAAAAAGGSMASAANLDTTSGELAGRKVAELAETIMFQGYSSYSFGGYAIYGLTDFPYRNTMALGTAWDDDSVDGADILACVQEMKQTSLNDRHYGPWVLYVPAAYETKLDSDFKAESDKTIRQRILDIQGIQDVKVADKLPANNVLLVQMTPDVIRLVEGLGVTNVEWATEGNMLFNFKVMAIWVPQIRADQDERSGIVHAAPV